MSIPVDVANLATALADFGPGYLLTAGANGRVKAVTVEPSVVEGVLVVAGAGRGSSANIAANPAVTLLFPPPEPRGFTLLVDGTAELDGRGRPGHGHQRRAAPPGLPRRRPARPPGRVRPRGRSRRRGAAATTATRSADLSLPAPEIAPTCHFRLLKPRRPGSSGSRNRADPSLLVVRRDGSIRP